MIFATTFLFWWHTTLVKFGWEIVPQCFLFEWKSVSEKFGREVAPPYFHFESKSKSHTEVAPPDFYFWTDFPFSCYRRGQWLHHIGPQKESHVFPTYKRQEHTSKTWAKHEQNMRNMWETLEQHMRNMWVFLGADYTALAPSSPSLMEMRVLPMPLSCRDNVLVLCKKLSKFNKPPLKSFEFFHQVYINLPLSGNVNKRKYRKPSKTVK